MPAASSKANYKTYEAQARMVRAIVAAHPEVKWNYKDIAKYFGQSTADGIQFQFRQIKRDAEELRNVERNGGNIAACLNLGSSSLGPKTPSKSTPARNIGSRSTGKRSRMTPAPAPSYTVKRSSSDEEDEDEVDFSGMDETPSKRTKTTGRVSQNRTPSRKAAHKANATIAAAARVESSESPQDMGTPPSTNDTVTSVESTEPKSLFAIVERPHPSYGIPQPAFNTGYDQFDSTGYYPSAEFDDGDGEI